MTPDDVEWIEDGVPMAFEVVPTVECWRCGLDALASAAKCPHCAAKLRASGDRSRRRAARPRDDAGPVNALIVGYFAMLGVSIVYAITLLTADPASAWKFETVAGLTFAGIALWVFAKVGRVPSPAPPPGTRPAAWLLAFPLLALALLLNFGYSHLIQEYLKVDWLPKQPPEPLTALSVFLNCVQPALVEEFFFRYLAIGVLCRVTGMHSAVVVTSGMFALAHLYNPLGMPYLFVAGLLFGYVRVYSRSMALPVVLHFVHNLTVILVEGN